MKNPDRSFVYKGLVLTLSSELVDHSYHENYNVRLNNIRFDHWKVTLKNSGSLQQASFDYQQGEGFGGKEPKIMDVLYSLLSDVSVFESCEDALDFANEFGYSLDTAEDIENIHKTWAGLEENHIKLKLVLPNIDFLELYNDRFADY